MVGIRDNGAHLRMEDARGKMRSSVGTAISGTTARLEGRIGVGMRTYDERERQHGKVSVEGKQRCTACPLKLNSQTGFL